MKTAFVTGGTGFVGLNLIKTLRQRDWKVVAIHRASSDLRYLAPFGAQLVVAELGDADAVLAAMPEAIDAVFHVAASTNLWRGNNAEQTRTNVDGTRNVVEAALKRRAGRLIHTSSVAAYGTHDGVRIDESATSNAPDHWVNYCRTKWLAEEQVVKGISRGLDAVILNPANIMGPYDLHNWSRLLVMLKQKRLPGVPPGAGAWCQVQDVVDAHLSAYERGRKGERYILGGPAASYADMLAISAERLGVKKPRPIPVAVLKALGLLNDWWSRVSGKEPDVTPETALLLSAHSDCDSSKATRELGYQTRALKEIVDSCYQWLLAEGRI